MLFLNRKYLEPSESMSLGVLRTTDTVNRNQSTSKQREGRMQGLVEWICTLQTTAHRPLEFMWGLRGGFVSKAHAWQTQGPELIQSLTHGFKEARMVECGVYLRQRGWEEKRE